jgi:amidase
MDEIWLQGAVAIAGLIRQRAVSVVEVVESFVRRIEAVNPAINAVVTLAAESAINEARAADRSIARGMVAGPFHGVPFTAKDVFETDRVETRVGLSERVGIVPSEDAVAVARMRRAGAILLGKTNVPPGGSGGVTDNSVYGRTRNPFDGSGLWPEAAAARRRSRRLGDRRSVSAATPVEASGCPLTTAGSFP